MDQVAILEQRRETLIQHWKQLAEKAAAAGMKELETHARTQLELYESPPPRVGDWIAKLAKSFGILPCSKCLKRQAALNAVDFAKPAAEVFRDLFTALVSPES